MPKIYYAYANLLVDDPEDTDVAGLYALEASDDAEFPVGAIKDAFHDSICIGVLDDFDISYFDADGQEVFEEDGSESGENINDGDFLGDVDLDDVPEALRRYVFETSAVAYICTYSVEGAEKRIQAASPAEFYEKIDAAIGARVFDAPEAHGIENLACKMVLEDGRVMKGHPPRLED